MYCQNCGKEVTGNFCPNCGAAVNGSPTPAPIPNAPAKEKKDTTKLFKIFSILSSVLCCLSLFVYLVSAFFEGVSDFLTALHIVGLSLFFVMSVILAVKIQPAKQWLSAIFYALSCGGLLIIVFFGFSYSFVVFALCLITIIFVIITAVFGKKVEKTNIQIRRIIAIAAILLAVSFATFAIARAINSRRNARLSDVSINGVQLTKEQLAVIDEDYILRLAMHNDLMLDNLADLNFKNSTNQSDTIPGIEYDTTDYPECDFLQIDTSSISYDVGTATVYDVTYNPVKIDDENLRKTVEIYMSLTGKNFMLGDSEYSFDDIVTSPTLEDGSASYRSNSSPDDDINLSLNLVVNKNGYATFSVMYIFPKAID